MQMEAIGYDSTEDKCIDEESRGKLWGTLFLRGRIKEDIQVANKHMKDAEHH